MVAGMSLRIEQLNIDAHDPDALSRWWARVLGWTVRHDPRDPDEWPVVPPAPEDGPELLFVAVPEIKMVKNRLHLDLRPDDQGAEVDRLIAHGATRANVGQGEQTWVVLADPEGNEFCVLSGRPPAPSYSPVT